MLKKSSSVVLVSLRGSTYGTEYASPLRSLRPHPVKGASWCAGVGWVKPVAFLNILRTALILPVTSKRSKRIECQNSFSTTC